MNGFCPLLIYHQKPYQICNLACASVLDEIETNTFKMKIIGIAASVKKLLAFNQKSLNCIQPNEGHFTPKESRASLAKIMLFSRGIHQISVNILLFWKNSFAFSNE